MVAGLDPPPHTPHPTEQDRLCRLRLIRSRRVGPATYHRLVAQYGSAQAALEALPEIARASGVQGYEPCPEGVAMAEMRAARAAGAKLLCRGDRHYPDALREIVDAPPILWLRGRPELLLTPLVGVVGARNASSLGLRMARRLAASLGEAGFTVVSGMARGIDAEAHAASLATGTVAVLAGGVDRVYPAENGPLMAQLAERGCLLSEQPPGLEPQARHFPMRNRIISGLSRALVVVEAAARSGSLITAKEAAEQGREVFAVPGHPFDARAAGCNLLIREGATLIRSASDVLEVLGAQGVQGSNRAEGAQSADAQGQGRRQERREGPLAMPDLPGPMPARRPLRDLAALHRKILDRLAPSPLAEDQLIRDLALPPDDVTPELLALEMEGALVRQPGGLLARS